MSRVLRGWGAGAAALTALVGLGIPAGGWRTGGTLGIALLLCGAALGAAALNLERAGYFGPEFTVALVTVANLSLFSALACLLSVGLHRTDIRRLRAETDLREVNAELEDRVRAARGSWPRRRRSNAASSRSRPKA